MEQVYFTTQERDGTVNNIDRIGGLSDCTDNFSIKIRVMASAKIDRLSATRWTVVRYEDRVAIPSFTTIESMLAMHPSPGLLDSPLVFISPRHFIKRYRSLFSIPFNAATVVSEEKFLRVPADLADLLFADEIIPHHSHQSCKPFEGTMGFYFV